MAEELPREQLLLKMLKMTTSDNDGTALVAIRKANALLESAGWTWDKLIEAKIKVVENPFKNMPNPTAARKMEQPAQSAPQPARTTARPPKPSTPAGTGLIWRYNVLFDIWDRVVDPAAAPKSAFRGLGLTRSNIYASHCYCCGDYVENQKGFIMNPSQYNSSAKDKWFAVCKSCEASKYPANIHPNPAPRNTGQTTVHAAPDLGKL